MTRDELLALANRLLYACRDPVTGEPLYPGVSSDACVEDVEAAARYLRDCAEAEPVATVRVHDTGGNAGIAWSAVPTVNAGVMRGGTPLYKHPQPPSAQADAAEALRGVASDHDIGYAAGWRSCADEAARIVASHIDRLEPGKQRRMRDALLDLLASMQSILVSQRAAKETSR